MERRSHDFPDTIGDTAAGRGLLVAWGGLILALAVGASLGGPQGRLGTGAIPHALFHVAVGGMAGIAIAGAVTLRRARRKGLLGLLAIGLLVATIVLFAGQFGEMVAAFLPSDAAHNVVAPYVSAPGFIATALLLLATSAALLAQKFRARGAALPGCG